MFGHEGRGPSRRRFGNQAVPSRRFRRLAASHLAAAPPSPHGDAGSTRNRRCSGPPAAAPVHAHLLVGRRPLVDPCSPLPASRACERRTGLLPGPRLQGRSPAPRFVRNLLMLRIQIALARRTCPGAAPSVRVWGGGGGNSVRRAVSHAPDLHRHAALRPLLPAERLLLPGPGFHRRGLRGPPPPLVAGSPHYDRHRTMAHRPPCPRRPSHPPTPPTRPRDRPAAAALRG